MKKTVLALGSALMLLANTALQAQDAMIFGAKAGGSLFGPIAKEATINGKEYEGKMNMFVGSGLFFDYMALDTMSVGLELAYSRKGFCLAPKEGNTSKVADLVVKPNEQASKAKEQIASKAKEQTEGTTTPENLTKKDNNYSNYIHALDITVPVAFLPMTREGGLFLFVGPKAYLVLANTVKEPGEEKGGKAEKPVVRPFNVGATAGVKYEIAESGFFVGATYEFFFLDTFKKSKEADTIKAEAFKKKADDKFYTQGAQAFVGFDFARLF